MRFDYFITSLFVGIAVLIGCIFIIADADEGLLPKYNVSANDTIWNNVSQQYNDIYDTGQDMKSGLAGEDISEDAAEDNLIKGAYNKLTSVWQFFRLANNLIAAVGKAIGVPAWALNILAIILMFSVLFAIIYMIFRFQPR